MKKLVEKAINDFYANQEVLKQYSGIDLSKPLTSAISEVDITHDLESASKLDKHAKEMVVGKAVNYAIDSINNTLMLYLDVEFKDNKVVVTFDKDKYTKEK